MISNVMLLYINLRLTEIFGTFDDADGWFGKRNILLFGDLLQLRPVNENPPYEQLGRAQLSKLIGSLRIPNLWEDLFLYDELTINMRQKSDIRYGETLQRVRLGTITANDVKLLETRKIPLNPNNKTINGYLTELIAYLQTMPDKTACLMPTCHMCDTINAAMLAALPGPEVKLVAEDSIDCARHLRGKVKEMLKKIGEDSTNTAGLDDVLVLKIGARIMLRRNLDVTLGLVNGALGTLVAVKWDPSKKSQAKYLTIKFSHGLVHDLEPTKAKFMVMAKGFIHRTQFPISVAYAITIHKSQGLSLENVVVDIGNKVFTSGQAYVALSRVTTLQGLHLIYFDPSQVKADHSAIVEFNRLRTLFRPDLPCIVFTAKKQRKMADNVWSTHPLADKAQLCQGASKQPKPKGRKRKLPQ